jgi:hypothetical protein
MRIVYQRCCGMDVHKNSITTCVLLIDDDGELRTEKRYFRTMTRDLKEMATWLASLEVEAIAIAYASHCTSLGRCETFSTNFSLFDNLTPLAFRGGLAPGSS